MPVPVATLLLTKMLFLISNAAVVADALVVWKIAALLKLAPEEVPARLIVLKNILMLLVAVEVILIPLTASVVLVVAGARKSPIRLLVALIVVPPNIIKPSTVPVAKLLLISPILFLEILTVVPAPTTKPRAVVPAAESPVIVFPVILTIGEALPVVKPVTALAVETSPVMVLLLIVSGLPPVKELLIVNPVTVPAVL